jgi:hypothetical protein
MPILGTIADLFSPNDPELVKKTLGRMSEQDIWNDVFSTKLIHVLDNIDSVKSEIRKGLRTVETSSKDGISAMARAERLYEKASLDITEAKGYLDRTVSHLSAAQSITEQATRVLNSQIGSVRGMTEQATRHFQAAQERLSSSDKTLQRAREMAAVAERKHLRSAQQFRTAIFYISLAVALSWIAMAWLMLRPTVPIWIALALSISLMFATILFHQRAKT